MLNQICHCFEVRIEGWQCAPVQDNKFETFTFSVKSCDHVFKCARLSINATCLGHALDICEQC